MNFTVDDTATAFQFSSGWNTADPTAASTAGFFLQTFHSTTQLSANATITFNGTAIYMYGSKGPLHGNYRVQRDDTVKILSGKAPNLIYQQLLFHDTFEAGTHTIVLSPAPLLTDGSTRVYVDLDFVVLTIPDTSGRPTTTLIGAIPSGAPPEALSSTSPSSIVQTTVVPSGPASSSSTSSKANLVPIILSAIFGAIILIALISFLIWYILRRREQNRRERERQFRVGNVSSPSNFQHRSNTPFSFDQWRTALGGSRSGTPPMSSATPSPGFKQNVYGAGAGAGAGYPGYPGSPLGVSGGNQMSQTRSDNMSLGAASRLGATYTYHPQSSSGRSLGQSIDMIDTDFLSVRS